MKREHVEMVTELRMALLSELGELSSEEEMEPLRRATRQFLARQPTTGRHFTSIAEEAGKLVGIASLEVFERLPYPGNLSGREGYVLNVYAEPAYRNQRVASSLVGDLVGLARREGVGRLWLHASAYGRGVYEAAGFEARTLEEMELVLAS
jgi:GNAT superfamily N-acetyltransferase